MNEWIPVSAASRLPSQGRSSRGEEGSFWSEGSCYILLLSTTTEVTPCEERAAHTMQTAGLWTRGLLSRLTKTSTHDQFPTPDGNGILQVGHRPGAGPWALPVPECERNSGRGRRSRSFNDMGNSYLRCLLRYSLLVWTPVSEGELGGWVGVLQILRLQTGLSP